MKSVVTRLYNCSDDEILMYINNTSKLPSFNKIETALLSMHSLIARFMAPDFVTHNYKYKEALLQVKKFPHTDERN